MYQVDTAMYERQSTNPFSTGRFIMFHLLSKVAPLLCPLCTNILLEKKKLRAFAFSKLNPWEEIYIENLTVV